MPCVIVDVDTQRDFLDEDGSCQAANRDVLVPALRRTIAWAKWRRVPIVSAVDCHRDGEVSQKGFSPHCVDGTRGQEKVDYSLFESYVKVEGDNTLAIPIDLFQHHQQAIFRKRTTDFFLNPKADRFITQLNTREYLVMGLGLEGSIKSIALGLLARAKKVSLIVDACGFWDPSKAELSLRQMEAKGVGMITVEQLRDHRAHREMRYPRRTNGLVSLRNGLYASTFQKNPYGTNGNGRRTGRNGQSHPVRPRSSRP